MSAKAYPSDTVDSLNSLYRRALGRIGIALEEAEDLMVAYEEEHDYPAFTKWR